MATRWTKTDEINIKKIVKNFNAKIARETKKNAQAGRSSDYLPDKLSVKEIRQAMKEMTRQDINRTKKSYQRFSSQKGSADLKTNKNGIKTTNWAVREVQYNVRVINAKKTRERKRLDNMQVKSRGEDQGYTRREMGSIRSNSLKPTKFNFDKQHGGKEWEERQESTRRMASNDYWVNRQEQYKDNYINALEREFGNLARDLIDHIKGLPASQVVDTYYSDQEATIDFIYDKAQQEEKLRALYAVWGLEYHGGDSGI